MAERVILLANDDVTELQILANSMQEYGTLLIAQTDRAAQELLTPEVNFLFCTELAGGWLHLVKIAIAQSIPPQNIGVISNNTEVVRAALHFKVNILPHTNYQVMKRSIRKVLGLI
jgi:hypothetical protein